MNLIGKLFFAVRISQDFDQLSFAMLLATLITSNVICDNGIIDEKKRKEIFDIVSSVKTGSVCGYCCTETLCKYWYISLFIKNHMQSLVIQLIKQE